MGLSFSRSKSSTTNIASTANVANYNTGSGPSQNLTIAGITLTGSGDTQFNIETSDYGAIAYAADISKEAMLRNSEAFSSASSLVARSQAAAQETMTKAADLIKEKAETESEKLLKIAGMIAALFILGGTAVFIYGGKGR